MGTAKVQGELWGAKAADWANIQEPAWRPVFERVLKEAGVQAGLSLLDVGCGAGGFLALARQHGAEVTGIDGSKNLVAIARQHVRGATIEEGEMEELPFADETFDVVTSINGFQFAENLVHALSEARRVSKRGGTVFMFTWGRPEDCQLISVTVRSLMALLPPPPPGAPGPLAGQNAEEAMREAGLQVTDKGEFGAELTFPNADTAVRAVMSAGVTVKAVQILGEEKVASTIRATLPAVTRPDGSIVWNNRFKWVRATKA